MRGKKAKQLRALTREHTAGHTHRVLQPVTTHGVRFVEKLDLAGKPVFGLAQIVNPIRMVETCTRRQYQINKAFYKRLRRGDEVIYG